jgi:PAS domain-containing protein
LDRERKRPQMNISLAAAEGILARALDVLNTGDRSLLAALDELPAAIYVTDAHGVITYYNPACLAFAGRVPALGQDRWCVTWKLFTEDGTFLPHDQCPMADAILTPNTRSGRVGRRRASRWHTSKLPAVSDTSFRFPGPVQWRR